MVAPQVRPRPGVALRRPVRDAGRRTRRPLTETFLGVRWACLTLTARGRRTGCPACPRSGAAWSSRTTPRRSPRRPGRSAGSCDGARAAAGRRPGSLRLGLPALILLVSVLITLAGLAAVTWPRTTRSGAPTVLPHGGGAAPQPVGPLPALDLVGADDTPVPLRSMLPAMIILTDACACAEQVTAAARAAPPGVTVVTVTAGRRGRLGERPGGTPTRRPGRRAALLPAPVRPARHRPGAAGRPAGRAGAGGAGAGSAVGLPGRPGPAGRLTDAQ